MAEGAKHWLERFLGAALPPLGEGVVALRQRALVAVTAILGAASLAGATAGALLYALSVRGGLALLACGGALTVACALVYWLARLGYASAAGYVLALASWAAVSAALWMGAWGGIGVLGYAVAVVLANAFAGAPGGLLVGVLAIVAYGVVGSGALRVEGLSDLLPPPGARPALETAGLGTLLLALWGLVWALEAQLRAWAAERSREAARQADAHDGAAREGEALAARIEEQERRQEALLDALQRATAPVLPLDEGFMVVPVSGDLDGDRVARILDAVLAAVDEHEAEVVLLDLTGAETVDGQAARGLVQVLRGVRLVGSRCVLVGVRPSVARAFVDLGADLAAIATYATLEEGLAALRRDAARPAAS